MGSKEALAGNSTASEYLEYLNIFHLTDRQTDRNVGVILVVYLLLAVVGILLNTMMLMRLLAMWKRQSDRDRFFESSAMPLTAMTCSDLLSLTVVIVLVRFTFASSEDTRNTGVETVKCKVSVFLLHTSVGVSRWCWLFASSLRYAAVYHPLWHRRQWRLGHRAMPIILMVSVIVNTWFLLTVRSTKRYCTEAPLLNDMQVHRWMHAIEMTWSFLAPVCITAALDVRVLFLRPSQSRALRQSRSGQSADYYCSVRRLSSSTASEQTLITVTNSRPTNTVTENRGRSQTAVYQWLAITSINLLLNAPDFILRLLTIFEIDFSNSFLFTSTAVDTARLLYFAQFCINASYLSTVVFRRPHTGSHGEKKTALKLSRFSASIVPLNVDDATDSNARSPPLLCLENTESWSAINACHF